VIPEKSKTKSWHFDESERLRSTKQATTRILEMCQREIANTSTGIQAEIQYSDTRTSSIEWAVLDINTERQRLERELESVRRQLAICEESNRFAEQKRRMIFERVSAGNQASQTIASNCEANIIARDIQIGDKTYQALGQLDAVTIQRTSQNHAALLAPLVVSSGMTLEARVGSSSQEQMTPQHESSHLPSQSTSDTYSLKDNIIRSEVRGQTQNTMAFDSRLSVL
jgi:septal ring factor EnvC (AmiA/AmiB activator)